MFSEFIAAILNAVIITHLRDNSLSCIRHVKTFAKLPGLS